MNPIPRAARITPEGIDPHFEERLRLVSHLTAEGDERLAMLVRDLLHVADRIKKRAVIMELSQQILDHLKDWDVDTSCDRPEDVLQWWGFGWDANRRVYNKLEWEE
jgi:hypothetical protein